MIRAVVQQTHSCQSTLPCEAAEEGVSVGMSERGGHARHRQREQRHSQTCHKQSGFPTFEHDRYRECAVGRLRLNLPLLLQLLLRLLHLHLLLSCPPPPPAQGSPPRPEPGFSWRRENNHFTVSSQGRRKLAVTAWRRAKLSGNDMVCL